MARSVDVDCLIFDIDGVLLDTRNSFLAVIERAVEEGWRREGGDADCPGYSDGFQRIFKRHGSFNDDYDIVWYLLLTALSSGEKKLSDALPSVEALERDLADCAGDCVPWIAKRLGDRVNRSDVRSLCARLYLGDEKTPGFYLNEKVMLPIHWSRLPLPVAIYTGRNNDEWQLAKKVLGWDDFPDDRIVHFDSGILKPSPEGLEILCARMGCERPLFFGDTASDQKALDTFGRGCFVAIGDLLPESEHRFDDPSSALESLIGFSVANDRVLSLMRPCVRKMAEYYPGLPMSEVRRLAGREDILRLCANESSDAPSPAVLSAMREALLETNRYPDSTAGSLRERLGERENLPPDWFLLGNGLDDVLNLLGLTFLNPGDEVVVPALTFPVYEGVARMMDAVPVSVPMREDFSVDPKGLAAAVTPRTKMLFLCNPNNPTGTRMARAEFEALLSRLPSHVILVLDEAYRDFVTDDDYPSGRDYLEANPNLVVLWTFSKIYGLAGLRLGCAVGHPELLAAMNRVRPPYTVNSVAQAGALAALKDEEFIKRGRERNAQVRAELCRFLDKMGVAHTPSHANFVFVRPGGDAGEIAKRLMENGILVRSLSHQGVPEGLRLSLGTERENEYLMKTLETLLCR